MSRRLHGVASLAFASTALAIPGCGEQPHPVEAKSPAPVAQDDGAAPAVAEAKVEGQSLTLRFSKPVVVPADLDPSKFRLTFGYHAKKSTAYSDYYYATTGLARTWYTDLSKFSTDTKVAQPSPDAIRIPLPADFKASWVCDDIHRISARGGAEAGLYLHYADSKGAGISDASGRKLNAIAPYWLTAASSSVAGDFDEKPLTVAIRCE